MTTTSARQRCILPDTLEPPGRQYLQASARHIDETQVQYPGEYLAMLGREVLAHGPELLSVRAEASRAAGAARQWVVYVPPESIPSRA